MKKYLNVALALMLCLSLVGMIFSPTPVGAEATGSISGHVYQSDGTTGIEGATVSIFEFEQILPVPWSLWEPREPRDGLTTGSARSAAGRTSHRSLRATVTRWGSRTITPWSPWEPRPSFPHGI